MYSRRVGNAVKRNRGKRLMREIFAGIRIACLRGRSRLWYCARVTIRTRVRILKRFLRAWENCRPARLGLICLLDGRPWSV